MTQRKPTPIAKAVEELSKIESENAHEIRAILHAIKILEGLKEYELQCIVYSFNAGFREVNSIEYFENNYTQEGGQS